jgi:hypothetical protein
MRRSLLVSGSTFERMPNPERFCLGDGGALELAILRGEGIEGGVQKGCRRWTEYIRLIRSHSLLGHWRLQPHMMT